MGRKRPLHCLLVGDAEHGDFSAVVSWIRLQTESVTVSHPQAAVEVAATLPPFRFLVVFQSRPGQFSSAAIEDLHRTWPLARLMAVLGTWCEGEHRSGRPWAGVWRLEATTAIHRLRPWLLAADSPVPTPLWQLPRLATEAERLVCANALPVPCLPHPATILVVARSLAAFEPLADLVRQVRCTPCWCRLSDRVAEPDFDRDVQGRDAQGRDSPGSDVLGRIAIWDAVRGDRCEWREMRRFAARQHLGGLLVLVGFPRQADRVLAASIGEQELGSAGQVVVLPKPYYFADVIGELVRLSDSIPRIDRDVRAGVSALAGKTAADSTSRAGRDDLGPPSKTA